MRHGKLLMITAAVLSAGAVAALPYHRAPSDDETRATETESTALPLRSNASQRPELVTLSLSPHDQLGDRSPAAEFLQAAKDQREPALEIPEIRRDDTLRSESAMPDLEPTFRPFTETIRLLRHAESKQVAAAESDTPDDLIPIDVPSAEPPRRHVVVDGDTLASLAARYLGDPEQSGTIFTANQHLLESPDVLPLGVELTIPAVAQQPAARRSVLGTPEAVSGPLHEQATSSTSDLVPIPAHMFGNG